MESVYHRIFGLDHAGQPVVYIYRNGALLTFTVQERTWEQIDRWLSKCEWYGPITEEEWDVIDQICVASVSECAHCGSSRKETKEWGWRMELRDPICCYPYQILEGAAA